MYPVSDAFAAAVRGSRRRASRLTVLNSVMQPTDVIAGEGSVVLDGTVTIDRTRDQRRTMSVSLADPDGTWTPTGPTSALYLNRLVRIERGLVLGSGATEWVTLGTFLLDEPQVSVTAAGASIQLAGTDRTKLAAFSSFGAPFTLPVGTRVRDAVRQLAADAGMGADDAQYDLVDGSAALGADITYEEGQGRLAAMMGLAHDHALELYPDAAGVLVLRPTIALADSPVVWTFARGADAIMLGLTKRLSDAQLFNHVVVVGESAGVGPFRGEARDLNPASPTYNPLDGSGPIGDRLAPVYRSALITSTFQAQQVAEAMLREVALVEEQVSVPSAPHPALEAGDVVAITERLSATADRYLLDTVTQPVGAGAMQITAKRLRSLT